MKKLSSRIMTLMLYTGVCAAQCIMISCGNGVGMRNNPDDILQADSSWTDSLWIRSIYMDVVECDDSEEQLVLIDSVEAKTTFYSQDGNIVKEELETPKRGICTYQYNGHGKLVSIASTVDNLCLYSYDDNDMFCIAKTYEGDASPTETYSYYPNGKLEWTNTYDGRTGRLLMKRRSFYKRGLVACDSVFIADSTGRDIPLEVHLYSYNGQHDIVEEHIINSYEGNTHRMYEYRLFDKQGNWLECMEYETHEFNNGEQKEEIIYHLFRQIDYGTKQ